MKPPKNKRNKGIDESRIVADGCKRLRVPTKKSAMKYNNRNRLLDEIFERVNNLVIKWYVSRNFMIIFL